MALDPKIDKVLAAWANSLDEQYKAGMAVVNMLPDDLSISKDYMRKPYEVKHELSALLQSVRASGDTYPLRYRIGMATKSYFDPVTPVGWEIGLIHLLSSDLKAFS